MNKISSALAARQALLEDGDRSRQSDLVGATVVSLSIVFEYRFKKHKLYPSGAVK